MRTILEYLTEAKEDNMEWADRAIENAIAHDCGEMRVYGLVNAIWLGFIWHSTIEGYQYWREVYDSL